MTVRDITILTGASRGMGLAMARQLLSASRHLLCISRSTGEALAAEALRLNAPLTQWSQDLSDTTGAAQRLRDWLTGLDTSALRSATLINNAGMIPRIGPLASCPPDELSAALRVGLEAPMQLTGAFLRATSAWVATGWQGPRKVLNISSGLGRRAMAAQAPYCAAKAGMDHFTRCCALEEAANPHGARLVSLAPGVIDTDMQVQLRAGDPEAFPDLQRFVELQRQGQLTPPDTAAARVLAWLDRPDFGDQPVADVRD
ncbi:MAG: SDR family NAD(P)-dependent oxidoreductase [Hydrogenophaga sp.]|uniref:SDR family NAD(P)-dependent oxidoreductase n=1 Tax=Hydrogenophaga sp. TaxID=1904254 RepID=UPI001BC1E35D|nr:SDR family NAD(P)-dependent oxidoreductase [Hydrogenophaga sp.]MBS3912086.1 SDR family NAD(P)-dependent oxidoreductase [Hydrogenophaga sp.]MDO9149096.1 SDR family NAD(P)-dependent oxidoreductase [Hydrogenophaga sp.]MDO9604530.1 SDR family NAD(P)-dependent oxidoreductase [Hydrogenophaga sp.]MDP2163678.1 SDR family NAD(P)-dependent oxidoreductase [Hydrogenophaga sp.]MDP3475976.1 SDR family NAD(P)-dependent oxidoreductase [Hydrogenophaga sp.]